MKNKAPHFHLVQIYDINEQKVLFDWICKGCKKKNDCQKFFIKQDKCYVAKQIISSENFNIIAHVNTFFNDMFLIKFDAENTHIKAENQILKICKDFHER